MQRVTRRFGIVVALTLMVALWGVYSPMDARGQIKQLTIGIGIDADTLNPQEQTTTLMQNMCALLFDTYCTSPLRASSNPVWSPSLRCRRTA